MKTHLFIRCLNAEVFRPSKELLDEFGSLYGTEFVERELRSAARWANSTVHPWPIAAAPSALRRWLARKYDEQVGQLAQQQSATNWKAHGFNSPDEYNAAIEAGCGPALNRETWQAFRDQYTGDFESAEWRDLYASKIRQLETFHRAVLGLDWKAKLNRFNTEREST